MLSLTASRSGWVGLEERGASRSTDLNFLIIVLIGEKREVKMESMAWFHGKISRDKAEELLLGSGVSS